MIQTKTLKLYEPHEAQQKIHASKARYRIASFGRQSGKSTLCVNEIAWHAWTKPETTYWYVSPTFEQARQQYRRLVGMLFGCPEVMVKKNQSELRIKLINMSSISFKSGESLDNLRGETLDGVVIDEFRDQHPELWGQVIRPMLTTTRGWAMFPSTPRGFDGFYDLYSRAEAGEKDWEAFHSPSTCNPLFTQEEFEAAKREMGEAEFAQEILAEFRELGTGKVYVNHGSWNQKTQNPFAVAGYDWSPYLPIVVGLDFNVGLMCWELAQFKGRDAYFGDEIAMPNTNTQEAVGALISKVKDHKAGVVLIGDASGKARKTSASETDYQILMRELKAACPNVRNLTPESNPGVKDRVNIMNASLKDATGQPHLFYHPTRCPRLKRDLERVTWKAGAGDAIFDKSDPLLTHPSDAAGYPVCHYSNEFRLRPGKMHVLIR